MDLTINNNLCRLCRSRSKTLKNIFLEAGNHGFCPAATIADLLHFHVSESDGYPKVICHDCLGKLNDFKDFKENCKKSKDAFDSEIAASVNTYPSRIKSVKDKPVPNLVKDEVLDDEEKAGTKIREGNSALGKCDKTETNQISIKEEDVEMDNSIPWQCQEEARLQSTDDQETGVDEEDFFRSGSDRHTDNTLTSKRSQPKLGEKKNTNVTSDKDVIQPYDHCSDRVCECHICKKVVRSWQQHLLSHKYEMTDKGKDCMTNQSRLNLQQRTHSTEKPYSCEFCGQKFLTIASLKSHWQIHSKNKHYRCDICSKTFVRSYHLLRHSRSHNNIRPHKCNVCNKMFTTKEYLNNHFKAHTNRKDYICPNCGKEFKYRQTLFYHKKQCNSK